MGMADFRREGRRLLLWSLACFLWPLCRRLIFDSLGDQLLHHPSAVRSRMKSVKNVQKITKAIKMLAASKL